MALFSFRRRMMSLLDWVYRVHQGHDQRDIVQLPCELVDELWSLILLCPLAVSDLRASFNEVVYMCDASNWGEAVVSAKVHSNIACEVHRHGVCKGAWTRLLSPWKAHQRSLGTLPTAEELPEGEVCYTGHPIWEVLARGLDYEVTWKRHCKGNRHINVGELQSFIKAEELGGLSHPDSRHATGSDSQVCIGAVCKGRSASPALNAVLQRSLPAHLGLGIYSCTGYVPSALNPSDDPTRGVAIRCSDITLPDWWHAIELGNMELFDAFLAESGLLPEQLAGYPPLGNLFAEDDDKSKRKSYKVFKQKVVQKIL